MRSVRMYATAALAVWAAVIVGAQGGKVSTPAEFDKVMKSVGQANGALQKAVKSSAWADARTALATMRQNFVLAETFWAAHKKDEAIKLTKEAIAKVDALDKALSAPPTDMTSVSTPLTEVAATCKTCHSGWRVRDAEGNYAINPEKMK